MLRYAELVLGVAIVLACVWSVIDPKNWVSELVVAGFGFTLLIVDTVWNGWSWLTLVILAGASWAGFSGYLRFSAATAEETQ